MQKLKILYLEDSPYDAELASRVLDKAGMSFDLKLVDTKDEFAEALSSYRPNVILSDHSLHGFNSSEALQLFKSFHLSVPFILVTGTVSEEFAVNILKEGADDYLLKSNLARLPIAIENAIEKFRLAKERQQFIENLIATEALMRAAEEMARFGSWQYDYLNKNMQWSLGLYHLLGYAAGEVEANHKTVIDHIHVADKYKYEQKIINPGKDLKSCTFEVKCFDRDDSPKYLSFQISNSFDSNGVLLWQLGFVQDVTEKKHLENELAQEVVARQKLVVGTTILAQERERKFLGQELHDNINQILTGSKIYLRLASMTSESEKKADLINKSMEQITQAVGEIRKLSKSLVAPTLGDVGLETALRELADDINLAQQLNVLIINDNDPSWKLDEPMELMFFRIAQEQLNNIRKYAKASEAVIHLSSDTSYNYFSISDNGVGFDIHVKSKGIGLKNISNRVSYYSGEMRITTAPGQGCRIDVKIPREQNKKQPSGSH